MSFVHIVWWGSLVIDSARHMGLGCGCQPRKSCLMVRRWDCKKKGPSRYWDLNQFYVTGRSTHTEREHSSVSIGTTVLYHSPPCVPTVVMRKLAIFHSGGQNFPGQRCDEDSVPRSVCSPYGQLWSQISPADRFPYKDNGRICPPYE